MRTFASVFISTGKVHRRLYSHRPAVELLLFDHHLLGSAVTGSRFRFSKNKREAVEDALLQKIG